MDEKTDVAKEMLSDYQLQIIEDNLFLCKNKNLINNLGNKSKCKLHYQNLKLCLSLGLQLIKNSQNIRIQTRTNFKAIYRK